MREGGGLPSQPSQRTSFESFLGPDDAEADLRPSASSPTMTMKPTNSTQKQVNDQERETAVRAHLIREAPEVAQSDGRADGRHQEAEIASPITTVCVP